MLLPAFFVGGRMAYTIFNKNAKDSYSGTNVDNEIYENKKVNNLSVGDYVYYTNNQQQQVQRVGTDLYIYCHDVTLNNVTYNNANVVQFYAYPSSPNSNTLYLVIKENDITLLSRDVMTGSYSCTFYFESYNSNNVSNNYVEGLTFYKITYNSYGNLDNAFDYSMSQLNELPLFSWAKDSFIVEPFQYITGLFGVPADSPISTLLSYWCAISIIWLVFDLLMYVPLLAHRWIDKGVLE